MLTLKRRAARLSLCADRKDKVKKDKLAVKLAKKNKWPEPKIMPEMKNPKIDEPCFAGLLKKLKINVADTKGVFKAANVSHTGLMSFHELVSVLATLKNADQPDEDKLDLVFRAYDRDQKGALDEAEVKVLIETGLDTALEPMPARTPDTKNMLKKQQAEVIMSEVESNFGSTVSYHARGKKRWGRHELSALLKNERLYEAIAPGAGIDEGGVSADQLVEATITKSSKLCVIL